MTGPDQPTTPSDRDHPVARRALDSAGASPRLPGAEEIDEVRRSVILETAVRLVFHTVVVFGLYLLFAGHNQPGGGFVGGLVVGCAFVLRYIAGGRGALAAAVPVDPGVPLGLGLLLAAGTGAAAWGFGGQYLESDYVELDLPLLGVAKLTSALSFDAGVFLVVVGLVLAILRTLGAEAEQ